MQIHHIGLVVKDIQKHFNLYFREQFKDFHLSQIYTFKKMGIRTAFINLNSNIQLELIEPAGPDSVISNFLEKKGQAFHHICFETRNIELELEKMRDKNYMVILPPTPSEVFNNRKISFVISEEADYLIEFLEKE